jgi:hypothetical protein
MTASQLQQNPNKPAGQERASSPLTLALPCAALSLALLAATVQARTPQGPKCLEPTPSAPGFDSLAPQVRPACIRIRI